MTQLLIVSPDPKASAEIEALASKLEVSSRTVSTLHVAKEWLSMQPFQAILVDAGPDATPAIEILEFAWKLYPLLHGAVFSFRREISERWKVVAAGAQVIHGADALFEVNRFLGALKQSEKNKDGDYSAVLYVEDLDSPREIMANYVQSLGYHEVYTVASAQEALERLEAEPNKFFCALVDILMPKTNGIVLTQQIRQNRLLAYLPIIILTAAPTTANLIECLKAGASGFLAKPPRKLLLLKELEKAKRIVLFQQSPRLCTPEQAHLLEEAISRNGILK